jgi:THAP domain
VLITDK